MRIYGCFAQLIDALFLPGIHNRDAVQRCDDLIYGVLFDKEKE